MDKDKSGALVKQEVVDAVQNDKEVVTFLQTCGRGGLQFLLQPKRIDKAMKELDTSKDGEIDEAEGRESEARGDRPFTGRCTAQAAAIQFKKRVEQLRSARAAEQAAGAEDAAFSEGFPELARVDLRHDGRGFQWVAGSGRDHEGGVKSNKEVIAFLVNCGNKYLQDLLVPARLEATLDELDADLDGEISAPELGARDRRRPEGEAPAARAGPRGARARGARRWRPSRPSSWRPPKRSSR